MDKSSFSAIANLVGGVRRRWTLKKDILLIRQNTLIKLLNWWGPLSLTHPSIHISVLVRSLILWGRERYAMALADLRIDRDYWKSLILWRATGFIYRDPVNWPGTLMPDPWVQQQRQHCFFARSAMGEQAWTCAASRPDPWMVTSGFTPSNGQAAPGWSSGQFGY